MIKATHKGLLFSFLLLLALPFSAPTTAKQIKDDRIQSASSGTVILEVMENWDGMVPISKWLFFRLYEFGRVEYDDLKDSPKTNRTEAIRQEKPISNLEYEEITQLLNAPDFLSAREYYKELWTGVDAVYITTIITYKQGVKKQIALVNFTEDDPKGNGYYPESVINLWIKLKKLREKKIR